MSREDLEVARRLWERIAEGGRTRRADAGLDQPGWHPDVEYVEDPNWPGTGSYRGRDAIRARFEEYLEVFGAVELTLEELLDAGDRVVVIFRTQGSSAQSGLPFEHEWAYVWRFREGQVVEWRAYFDKEEALRAVDVSA